jgi:threonine dehydratase
VPRTGRTILVASGGNVDPGLLIRVIRHGLGTAGRYLFLRVRLRDRPGELGRVLALLGELFVNVVSVVHHRAGLVAAVDDVEVELTLETRGREHADEVVRALGSAGYRVTL